MLRLLKTAEKPKILFTCKPELQGVIAEPRLAKTFIPDWFRKLPAVDGEHLHATNNGLTVKRCMPFLDAMTTGWIIPLAATVRLVIRDGGATVDAGWDIDQTMVSNHGPHQVAGHPAGARPPCKFHNYWTVTTPPGWSCLFVPLINRPNPVVDIVSGVVDTDSYRSLINFPFFAVAEDGVHTLERGTPLVQVIPFRRDASQIDGEVRPETPAEAELKTRILRQTQASEGWYRKVARAIR